jgi:hypothetical protein
MAYGKIDPKIEAQLAKAREEAMHDITLILSTVEEEIDPMNATIAQLRALMVDLERRVERMERN